MGIVVYTVVQIQAQQAGAVTGDFTAAAAAAVRDENGEVILRGTFIPEEGDDDEMERKGVLAGTGVGPDARGEAAVEFSKAAPIEQEIEFEVINVNPGSRITFTIDGRDIATVVADNKGVAEFEADIR
jgi:hypothetical protein